MIVLYLVICAIAGFTIGWCLGLLILRGMER